MLSVIYIQPNLMLIFVQTNGAVPRTKTQKPCLSMRGSKTSLLHENINTEVRDKKQPLHRIRCPLIQIHCINFFFKEAKQHTMNQSIKCMNPTELQWISEFTQIWYVASLSSIGCLITLLQLLFKAHLQTDWFLFDQSCFYSQTINLHRNTKGLIFCLGNNTHNDS